MSNKERLASSLPWYKDGLGFQCTQCGKCCTGQPGYIWVDEGEMAAMAKILGITVDLFKRRYTRQRDNRYALTEKKSQNQFLTQDGYDCVFLKDKKCQVYQSRPSQCRTYPWWKENLNSEESWKLAAKECEGINDQSPVVPFEQIIDTLKMNDGGQTWGETNGLKTREFPL
jgi:uncharacterized protein